MAGGGALLGVVFIGYNLVYNTTIFLNKDDRMHELPEEARLGAAYQNHALRSFLAKHYYPHGADRVEPFLLPFKHLNERFGGASGPSYDQVPHEHTVAGMPERAWADFVAGAKRHLRLLRQPNVDPADSLVRDTRPLKEQLMHVGTPDEHRHPKDAALLYHPRPVPLAEMRAAAA